MANASTEIWCATVATTARMGATRASAARTAGAWKSDSAATTEPASLPNLCLLVNIFSECYTEEGVAYQGKNVGGKHKKVTGVESCRTLCQEKEGAKFFTYMKNRNCICKTEKGDEKSKRKAQSGIVLDGDSVLRNSIFS